MKNYLWYIGKKLLRLLLLLLAGAALAFFLTAASPIDPLQANLGQAALGSLSPEQLARLESYWGLDTPPLERFLAWFGSLLRGDLGLSLLYRQPVLQIIGEKLSYSLLALLIAWLLSGVLGFFLGLWAGLRQGGAADKLIKSYALLTAATPSFWLALLLLMLFSVWLGLLPIGLATPIGMEAAAVRFSDRLLHAILPALTLTLLSMANMILHTREKTIEVLGSEHVRYARSRGERGWPLLRRHVLRHSLLPALSLQCASISEIIGGSVLVEQVFSYPGLGQAAVTAALGSDVPLLLGITLVTTAIVFLGNLLADLLYSLIDPRIRSQLRQAGSPALPSKLGSARPQLSHASIHAHGNSQSNSQSQPQSQSQPIHTNKRHYQPAPHQVATEETADAGLSRPDSEQEGGAAHD